MNITITFDISPALRSALSEIVGARASIFTSVIPSTESEVTETTVASVAVEAAPETPQNVGEQPVAVDATSEPEKPKKRQKKAVDSASSHEATPAPEVATAPEPAPEPAPAPEKDMSGKGEKGEILSDLTRRALTELDEAGVARDESNRRIRDYGIRHGLKFPSFTALVQLLGYADAVAVAKGEIDD